MIQWKKNWTGGGPLFSKHIACITKHLIEEKEFFLHLSKPLENPFDLALYKQIWRRKYFIGYIDGNEFLNGSIDYQKSLLFNLYSEEKLKNSFTKLFFYQILLVDRSLMNDHLEHLEALFTWIEHEKININIILYDISSGQTRSLYSKFQDSEKITEFLSVHGPKIQDLYIESINLLEIEEQMRRDKGYLFERKGFYFTTLLMAINVLYWLFMSMKGSTTDTYHLIEYGAKFNPLIAGGEYYRLLVSIFIHIGLPHLLFNTYALNLLGKDVELIYGSKKFIVIYLISGLFGSLSSFLFSKALSAGASGAIFGLMGAYLYFGIRKPAIFSARYGMNLITMLVLNIFFGLTNSNIDNFAHLGGLVGGFLASCAFGLKKDRTFRPKGIFFQALILFMMGTFLFTGIRIHQNTWEYHIHKGVEYLRQNDFSHAREHFEKGMVERPNIPEFYFYLAFIAYHEGDADLAVLYLKKNLELNPNDTMARKFLEEIKRE